MFPWFFRSSIRDKVFFFSSPVKLNFYSIFPCITIPTQKKIPWSIFLFIPLSLPFAMFPLFVCSCIRNKIFFFSRLVVFAHLLFIWKNKCILIFFNIFSPIASTCRFFIITKIKLQKIRAFFFFFFSRLIVFAYLLFIWKLILYLYFNIFPTNCRDMQILFDKENKVAKIRVYFFSRLVIFIYLLFIWK